MAKNQIARILPTLQKNKAPAAEGHGRGRGTQQLGGYCGLVKVGNKSGLEVDLGVVVAALQQLFHLFLAGLARVGTGAGVGNRVLGDFGQSLKEDILRHEALLCGVGVGAVVADAVRNVQIALKAMTLGRYMALAAPWMM